VARQIFILPPKSSLVKFLILLGFSSTGGYGDLDCSVASLIIFFQRPKDLIALFFFFREYLLSIGIIFSTPISTLFSRK